MLSASAEETAVVVVEMVIAPEAFTFRRLDAVFVLLFVDPAIRELPSEFVLDVRGRRHPRLAAYWDGVAYRV